MVRFGSVEELGNFIGRTIPPTKRTRAELFLDLASASVQASTRQHLALVVDDTIELRPIANPSGTAHELMLPERPVLEVGAASIDTLPITGFEVSRWGRLRWRLGSLTSSRYLGPETGWPPIVRITYTHGYATSAADIPDPNPLGITPLPEDLKAIVLQAAARGFVNPLGDHHEETGTYRVDHDGGLELTKQEHAMARRYRTTTRS